MTEDAAAVFFGLWRMLAETHGGFALEPEYRFTPDRRWRLDAAAPLERVAIEIEGGTWGVSSRRPCPLCGQRQVGRHTTGAGHEADLEKYNALAEAGWVRLAYTPRMLDTDPVGVVCQVLKVLEARAAGDRADVWGCVLCEILTQTSNVVK